MTASEGARGSKGKEQGEGAGGEVMEAGGEVFTAAVHMFIGVMRVVSEWGHTGPGRCSRRPPGLAGP